MKGWARRTAELHTELAAIADTDPRWWLLAGGAAAAEPWPPRAAYVISDAEPGADTFLGFRAGCAADRPADPLADAIGRAHAARRALRALDGQLPDQPLAVTIRRDGDAFVEPSRLDAAAFAIGERCLTADLDAPELAAQLARFAAGAPVAPWRGAPPFVCISIGDEPLATARHGHRRAWTTAGGPWLGLGRAGDLAIVSTCHMIVDGYGHARIAALLAAAAPPDVAARSEEPPPTALPPLAPVAAPAWSTSTGFADAVVPLAGSPGAVPLGIAWRALATPVPRAIPLAYALGRVLHRATGRPDARFSPTFQIPIAPGARDDPMRRRRRVVPAIVSVRFEDGRPEPFAAFDARAREALAREADGHGLCTRLLAAARAAPAPLAWKRKGISATRPRWLDRFAEVIGGRACLSSIHVDAPLPPTCAVSSPARIATARDPLGGCVITMLDDGRHAAITACGSGLAGTPAAAAELLDELLGLVGR